MLRHNSLTIILLFKANFFVINLNVCFWQINSLTIIRNLDKYPINKGIKMCVCKSTSNFVIDLGDKLANHRG